MPSGKAGRRPDPRQLKERLQRIAQERTGLVAKRLSEPLAPAPIPAEPPAIDPPSGDAYAFVAYPHADLEIAQKLVHDLGQRGIAVRWDKHLVGGENFRRRLDELLDGAAAVIVIWSENVTDFVIDEADAGKSRGTLVTCRVSGLPTSKVPTGFRGLHCIDVDDIEAILRALEQRGLAATSR
ncbi:MAG: toll/interleukin-1 receptor domain-containing protein [Hyphomicrobiaceae bacterium]